MTIKKIVSVFLCAAFMFTSAGAVEVYDLEQDTVPKFSLMASGYDVVLAEVSQSELDSSLASFARNFLAPGNGSTIYSLLNQRFNSYFDRTSQNSPFWSNSSYLSSSGNSTTTSMNVSISDLMNSGFLGLSTNIKALSSSFDLSSLVTAVNTNTTAVNSVVTAVNSNKSAVDLVRSAVNSTTVAVNGTTSAVEDTTAAVNLTTDAVQSVESFLGSLFTSPVGSYYVDTSGSLVELSVARPFEWIFRNSSIAISKSLYSSSGDSFLNLYGLQSSFDSKTGLQSSVRHGFLGLRSLIAGSESDNVYSGSLIDNQNITSQFSATGLGPMLQRYLQEIQHDSGLLTYIFASPEDLEMKENSSSSMSAINDSFIDPDSDTSVSVSDIGTLSSAAGSIESFGSTGVTPDQAFAQLGNDSIFAFFSQTTADNLDSRPSSYSLRDPAPQIVTNYFSESRAEFFNLIGEGSE